MRLHWFLPVWRGKKADGNAPSGLLRRVLARMGPTWVSSPVRRGIQVGCFVAFAWLFFYVCWPYTAQPAEVWSGWLPEKVDPQTGEVHLLADVPPARPLLEGGTFYLVDAAAFEPRDLGRFTLSQAEADRLVLVPIEPPSADRLDMLSSSFGPWSIHQRRPGSWPSHYADSLESKELVEAELFLAVDPLVSLSTAIAARAWVWSLVFAGIILAACLVIPRGFCGYVCPLGTLIDVVDWAFTRRIRRFRLEGDGWWVSLKYHVLAAVLTASVFGVLVSGYVAAIPVVTRAMQFLVSPLQMSAARGWHQVPSWGPGNVVSIGLFLAVLGLGLFRPRFWCRYVCPTGALFSLANLLRLSRRKVKSACIECNKCVDICPFGAVRPDFTTRFVDCTFCQTCGGICPTHAIEFVPRWNRTDEKDNQPAGDPKLVETPLARRAFFATACGLAAGCACGAGAAAGTTAYGARLDDPTQPRPVRPPGSVPEREFLQLCIRCGECFQACPNNVLQPLGFGQGLEGLWTPHVVADWSGCEPSCSNCGRVCPTGAIRPLPIDEKRVARIGLAVVEKKACFPYAGREECQLCVDECRAAGYEAIEFVRIGTEADDSGLPIEGTGMLAPVVLAERCVGCGLCQTRCHAVNVKQKKMLKKSAIVVESGPGREDRLLDGSYRELRRQEEQARNQRRRQQRESTGGESYLPDFLR